ncbi:MAG: hypothetical protein HYZ28_21320 [Myxococcales bacterium]|nr:hypothetical protein [Myxococcales bacterium]
MTDARTATAAELDRFFREVVLCLGGIFATQDCADDLVWQAMKSLDRIYQRNRARLLEREAAGDNEPPTRRVEPHPAVEDVLSRIGR